MQPASGLCPWFNRSQGSPAAAGQPLGYRIQRRWRWLGIWEGKRYFQVVEGDFQARERPFSSIGTSFRASKRYFQVLENSFQVMKSTFWAVKRTFSVLGNSFWVMEKCFQAPENSFQAMKNTFSAVKRTFRALENRVLAGKPSIRAVAKDLQARDSLFQRLKSLKNQGGRLTQPPLQMPARARGPPECS